MPSTSSFLALMQPVDIESTAIFSSATTTRGRRTTRDNINFLKWYIAY